MTDETGEARPDAERGDARSVRRKIYIRERLPTVLIEMKSVADERKALIEKRKLAKPEDRKEMNRRQNFLAERLSVLRAERASLIEERDGSVLQLAKEKDTK